VPTVYFNGARPASPPAPPPEAQPPSSPPEAYPRPFAPPNAPADMGRHCIFMEKVEGTSVKELLLSDALAGDTRDAVLAEIGTAVAALHDGGLVHGDLTTSNLLVRAADGRVVVIDFGLAYGSTLVEDKAVDLYVLERAISSAHDGDTEMFKQILASYAKASRKAASVIDRFKDVRMRGRKRPMIG